MFNISLKQVFKIFGHSKTAETIYNFFFSKKNNILYEISLELSKGKVYHYKSFIFYLGEGEQLSMAVSPSSPHPYFKNNVPFVPPMSIFHSRLHNLFKLDRNIVLDVKNVQILPLRKKASRAL